MIKAFKKQKPVRPKLSYWISANGSRKIDCGECGGKVGILYSDDSFEINNYCPNCGQKIDTDKKWVYYQAHEDFRTGEEDKQWKEFLNGK